MQQRQNCLCHIQFTKLQKYGHYKNYTDTFNKDKSFSPTVTKLPEKQRATPVSIARKIKYKFSTYPKYGLSNLLR